MHKTAAGHRAVQEKRANLSEQGQSSIKDSQWVGKKMERKCVWEVSASPAKLEKEKVRSC